MAIVIVYPKKVDPWVKALKDIDPQLDIRLYPNDPRREEVDFALTWRHPYGLFSKYPNLRCISSMGAGVDHLLRDPDLPRQVTITRLVDPFLAQDMAEFVLALVMGHLRNLGGFKLKQINREWQPSGYTRIQDITLGVMGMGAIGKSVALQLQKSGFRVLGWARTPKGWPEIKVYSGASGFSDFLSQSNILVCVLPLTPQTQGIINKNILQQLPKNAFVINVGRGEHLVEEDLVAMINEGHIAGASLDVFAEEPLPKDSPLWNHPRLNITPHIASLTDPVSVAPQILKNYYLLKEGKNLLNTVDLKKGY